MRTTTISIVALTLGLCACGGELQKMSDAKLRSKAAECRGKVSRAKAVVCDQVRKECDRRDIGC